MRRLLILMAAAGALAALAPERPGTKAAPRDAAGAPLAVACPQQDPDCVPPPVAREFRGVWVATVRNIDWPSKPGLPPSLAKDELITLLDRAASMGLNAVIFQVRPAADALYASKIEPWSEYLTGRQGLPPAPLWDPLAFAVKEAHARGLELHAWFNPYRAKDPGAKSPLASTHIARVYPALVKKYGKQLWMDPGEPAVRARTLRVVLDVVNRYDIDGVHLDDYFYPYPERRRNGSMEFPDDRSWARYRKSGGTLERNDWRRANVDLLIDTLHKAIAKAKPWVKFGISPFGIWRPANPETVTGFDAYEKLFADSRKWLQQGWADYFTPQLYWPMEKEGQRYPELLRWWVEQDSLQRHLWPGNYTSKVGDGWRRDEVLAQVRATREQKGSTGNVHFSMKVLLENRDSVATSLERLVYADPALVPASPWMASAPIGAPAIDVIQAKEDEVVVLTPAGKDVVRWWLVQLRVGGRWETRLFDGDLRRAPLASLLRNPLVSPELLSVTA
ncbi:MAG: glycoside hydrolase family 10 protein, partial [Gemmatimonadales bacterium]